MSLNKIETSKYLELAELTKVRETSSILRGIEQLSELSEVGKAKAVYSVVTHILDESRKGTDILPGKRNDAINSLKQLMLIDEQVGGMETVSAAPRVIMVMSSLSKAETEQDQMRFSVLNELISAEMGDKFLHMIDAEWAKPEKLTTYVNTLINRIWRMRMGMKRRQMKETEDSMVFDSYERLDQLLMTIQARTEVLIEDEVGNVQGDVEEDLCNLIYEKMSPNNKMFLKEMAEIGYDGAVEFLSTAGVDDLDDEDSSYLGGETSDEE